MTIIPRPHLPWLFRDRSAGWAAGICAGLSQATGIRPLAIRAAAIAGLYFYPIALPLLYAAAAILLKDRSSPDLTISLGSESQSQLDQYHAISDRIAMLEEGVVSGEHELRRKFRDAGLTKDPS